MCGCDISLMRWYRLCVPTGGQFIRAYYIGCACVSLITISRLRGGCSQLISPAVTAGAALYAINSPRWTSYCHAMASIKISPTAVVAALDDLTTEKAKELFFHLKVKLKTLDDIDINHAGNMRKIHYVQAWFDQEVEASWEKIVAGLKQIGMNALAETLATQQCLGGTPISAAVNLTLDLPSSQATAPEASSPQTSVSSPSDPALSHMASPSSPSSHSDRVSQVKAEIDRLIVCFSSLMFDTQAELSVKESKDPSFLINVVDGLLGLPVAQKAPHSKFFHKNEDDFLMAKNMRKVFAILRRYCNYNNYEILREVVRMFCEAVLQRRMQGYCESLEKFEKATAIDVYLEAISAGVVLTSEFTKMVLIVNKPASECTLHEVRKLKETIAERASLQSYSVYVGDMSESSVQLELGFPASCVGWILGVFTRDFLATHRLSDVVLGQQHLSTLDLPQRSWYVQFNVLRALPEPFIN